MINGFCKRYSGIAVCHEKKRLFRLSCNQWICAYCAKNLARSWWHHLMTGIVKIGETWSFHTITCPKWIHDLPDDEERAKHSAMWIKNEWDKLSKTMKRIFKHKQYIRVLEKHKSAALHIHLLINVHVDEDDLKIANAGTDKEYTYSKKLKAALGKSHWGFICSSSNLPIADYQRAVSYTTKYMTKEDDFIYKYIKDLKIRRILTSRGFGAMKHAKPNDIWVIMPSIGKQALGYVDMDTGLILDDADFWDFGSYPPRDEKR